MCACSVCVDNSYIALVWVLVKTITLLFNNTKLSVLSAYGHSTCGRLNVWLKSNRVGMVYLYSTGITSSLFESFSANNIKCIYTVHITVM